MSEKINIIFCFFIFLACFLPPAVVLSEDRTNIAIIPMKNNSDMPEYTTLCETVTDTVTSVIRFLPDYTLYEATDNPDLLTVNTSNMENLKAFSEKHSYDEILFGDLSRDEQDKLLFQLQIYDLREHDIIVEHEAIAETLLDVFDTADMMTLALLGQITDVNIGFGTIELTKTSGLGTYDVYLDKKQIRNPKKTFEKVLNGDYLLEIRQDRLLGDTVIFSNRIYVNEFQTTTVRFSIPPATEEELRFILIKNSEILDTASDPDNIDQFLSEIAEFQELTRNITYDPELVQLKDTILDELGQRAAYLLEETMEQADSTYYSDDPDFEGANQIYSHITGLVNNNFSYSFAVGKLTAPREVLYSSADVFYLLDGTDIPRLSSFGPDAVPVASRELLDFDTPPESVNLAVDSEGNCFVFAPGTNSVLRYTPELEGPVRLTIPDYNADPEEHPRIAVSEGNAVYLLGNDRNIVFEYTLANELTIERDSVIEEALTTVLETAGGGTLGTAFFDTSNILHLFFPETGEVLQLTSLGELASSVQLPGSSAESNIALDTMGYYYVTLPGEDRVVKFSPKGEFISEFGGSGSDEGQFNRPEGIAVDNDGTVYVAEGGNNRLQILTLAAPPLLLPAVARYGEQFDRRKETSEQAVRKFQGVTVDGTFLKSTVKFAVPLGIMASSFGFGVLDTILYRSSMENLAEYQNSTDAERVEELRAKSSRNWIFSRMSHYTGYAAMGVGSYWLASSITESIDGKVQKGRTIEYLQSFDMDKEYDVDEKKFRSLQTARVAGLTTGLLPPIIGGTAALVLSLFPEINPQIPHIVAAGCIAVPPIFAHVYAGQMSWGSFVTGLIADAFAFTAFLFTKDVHQSVYLDSIEDPVERGNTYVSQSFEYMMSNYYLVGALAFRFAAGLHDFKKGWERANEYNTYEAVTERPSPLSMQVSPYMDNRGAPGIAVNLQL